MRLFAIFGLIAFSVSLGSPRVEASEVHGLKITIQPDLFHFFGEVPDEFTAIGLHQITNLASPGSRCIDDVVITPDAPGLIQPRLLAGLLSELSLSTSGATLHLDGHEMKLSTATRSRVTEAAILIRIQQLEKAGIRFENDFRFLNDDAENPDLSLIALAEKEPAKTLRPDYDTAFLIAESERITLKLAENIVAEAAAPDASLQVAPPVAIDVEETPTPNAPPKPAPPRGISFPPETFVLTGRQRTGVADFAEEIISRSDLEEDEVILRVSLPKQAGESFSEWMANEQLDSVKLGLISRGVAGNLMRTEVVKTDDQMAVYENHIAIILPDPPALAETETITDGAHSFLPAQQVSSLAVPALVTP